ncbi:MAG TPA: prolyl oligopeptidase family serine peptidase [Bosea sp. (in: a-proteobacteria)]
MSSLAAGLLLFCSTMPGAAQRRGDPATPFPARDLVEGTQADERNCAEEEGAVWVSHKLGTECLATYASHPAPKQDQAQPETLVIYLHGDHLSGRAPIGDYEKITPETLIRNMRRQSFKPGVTYLLLARPGVFGSSGDHKQRRRAKEFHSIAAAIEVLRERYRSPRVVVVGQSGGSAAIGAVLTLGARNIACAVMGSGVYAVNARAEFRRKLLGQRPRPGCDVTGYCDAYESIAHIAGIVRDPERRLIVVGDPRDQNTPFALQMDWVDRLRQAGHGVEVVETEGRGPDHHGVARTSFQVARGCIPPL